ncbi:MAG: hypothetical protein H8D72_01775 [Planctomycetes bacterium]|nr:hypothetical protein [Planctomycetota bacterium]
MLRLSSALCVALLSSSCLSGTYDRMRKHEVYSDAQLDSLAVGTADLGDCLATLGAPTRVWEIEGGAALAWHWMNLKVWGVTLALPMGRGGNANLSYADLAEGDEGAVLFFQEDWTLVELRRGQIAKLIEEARRRPAFLE